jgi:hypothetical protein
MNQQLQKQQWLETELRNLINQCGEALDVSAVMFRVLKERIIEEWKSEQYIAWLDWRDESSKASAINPESEDPVLCLRVPRS